MGEAIASKAAADDIFADIETTLARAVARGGKWKEIGESRLAPVRGVITSLQARLSAAEAEFLPVKATIEVQDKRSDQLIGQISDEIWNAIRRPAFDPTFDVVFPGGIAHYTKGANEDQPERMELLEMKLLSKVGPTLLVATVQRVRDEAAAYRKVVEAASQSRVRVQQLQRAKTAVAQSARMGTCSPEAFVQGRRVL